MAKVYVGIGSNIHRYQHVTAALEALQQLFVELARKSDFGSLSAVKPVKIRGH